MKIPYYNYLLIDGARAEFNLYTAMELNNNYQSLYKGGAEEELEGVAPYLFAVKDGSPFADWFLKEGLNQSWGILLFSNVSFEDLYKHLRKLLTVKTEEGVQLYFRFYDPRVLSLFLPTCNQSQLAEIFGPIRYFLIESETEDNLLQCFCENGNLRTNNISAKTVVDLKNESETAEMKVNLTKPQVELQSKSSKTPHRVNKWNFDLRE